MGAKIEIFRMLVYLSFPVTMFWISNQAEFFEEYVVKKMREALPADEHLRRKELEDFKERMRARKEQQRLKKISIESEP
ncbi:protein PET100 homolog, mitochondrial [Festucalex cinctus]